MILFVVYQPKNQQLKQVLLQSVACLDYLCSNSTDGRDMRMHGADYAERDKAGRVDAPACFPSCLVFGTQQQECSNWFMLNEAI